MRLNASEHFFSAHLTPATPLLIGIGCITTIAVMATRNAFSPPYFTPVEVTGLYWHLVDVIWLFVFPILYLISRS